MPESPPHPPTPGHHGRPAVRPPRPQHRPEARLCEHFPSVGLRRGHHVSSFHASQPRPVLANYSQ